MLKFNSVARPVKLLTVSTSIRKGLPAFLESALRFGWDPIPLGVGRGWLGWGTKFKLIAEYLRSSSADLVCYCDGFDSVVLAGPDEVAEKFSFFGHPFVVSTQLGCWPDAWRLELHPVGPTPYRTLNAGGFLVQRDYFLDMLGSRPIGDDEDDQRYLTDLFLGSNDFLAPDYRQEIFGTCGQTNLGFSQGRVKNMVTGSYPSFVHGNGGLDIRWVMKVAGVGGMLDAHY